MQRTRKKTKPKEKRRHTRFTPDTGDYGTIDLMPARKGGEFRPTLVALIIEESYSGCGMVVIRPPASFAVDTFCRIQVGRLNPMKARVVWTQAIDSVAKIFKVGFAYQE